MGVSLPRLAFLGTGKMSGAILTGVVQPGVDVAGIRATTQSEHSAAALRERGIDAKSVDAEPEANRWAVDGADVVVLGVKPPYIVELAASVREAVSPEAVFVSVAAGITTAQIDAVCDNPVVRAMPNTPSQIQQGVTGVAAGSRASDRHVAVVSDVFSQVGQVVVVREDQIDALSAISGSGPAYVFYLAEKLIDVARSRGFTDEQAQTMVRGTLLGASSLLAQSEHTADALRLAVTSPRGTTEQAIAVFDEHDLGSVIDEAVTRAVARAHELSAGA